MARFQRLACPSCGGALDVPTKHEQFFTCATCGSTLEDTQYTAPTRQVSLSLADVLAHAGLDERALPSYAAKATKAASKVALGIGVVVTLLAVGGIGIGVWAAARAVRTATDGAADGFGIYSFANSALVTADGPVGEVALVTNGADGEHLIYVDLGSADPVRWDTPIGEILPADASIAGYERLIASPTRVVMTFADHLYAFDRTTGSLVYEHGLPDAVVNYCEACLRVLGDTHLAGLTAEGTLQVWDVATGAQLWSTNVPGDVPRHLLDAGGNPAVATRTDEQGSAVTVYDVGSGTVVQRQPVECGDARSGQVHPFDQLIELDDGGYLWPGGILAACVQRWSVGGTAPDWQVTMPIDPSSNTPVALEPEEALVNGSTAVIPTRTGLATIDVSTGSVAVFNRPDVRDLRPVALADDMAVVIEYNSRGTGKWLLVGVSTADAAGAGAAGVTAWQFELEGDDGSDGSITGREWVVESTPAGIAIVEFDVDADQVRTRLIDPATGTAGAPATLAIDDLVFTQLVGWRNGNVVIGADDRLIEIDPATAAIVNSAPEQVARSAGVR